MGSLHRIHRRKRDRKKAIINYLMWGTSCLLCFLIFLDIQTWILNVCDRETPENTECVQGVITNVTNRGVNSRNQTVCFAVDGVSLYLSSNRNGTEKYYELEESQEQVRILYTKEDRRILWNRLFPAEAFYVVDLQTDERTYDSINIHNRTELFSFAMGTLLNLLFWTFIIVVRYIWFQVIYEKREKTRAKRE